MDNPRMHCISELLEWLPHWMLDDPWIIHGNPWIHCIFELLGWLPHWMSDARYMDNPWIHCIPELLCQGPGLKPHYPAILSSKPGP